VRDAFDATVRGELDALRTALGRHRGQVVHFRNLTHSYKVKACQEIAGFSVEAITNVIFCKPKLAGQLPAGGYAFIKQADPMYLYAIRLLLERVSWYVDEHGGDPAIVTFAHLSRFPAAKLHNYRAALEYVGTTEIRWHVFAGHQFRINHPNTVELLQAADSAASALFKAVEADAFGNTEPRYLQELRPKLYRRGSANVTSYGLKVFPTSECKVGGSLDFLHNY
jgi:class 3 adenylate cyclase